MKNEIVSTILFTEDSAGSWSYIAKRSEGRHKEDTKFPKLEDAFKSAGSAVVSLAAQERAAQLAIRRAALEAKGESPARQRKPPKMPKLEPGTIVYSDARLLRTKTLQVVSDELSEYEPDRAVTVSLVADPGHRFPQKRNRLIIPQEENTDV